MCICFSHVFGKNLRTDKPKDFIGRNVLLMFLLVLRLDVRTCGSHLILKLLCLSIVGLVVVEYDVENDTKKLQVTYFRIVVGL